MIKTRKIDRSTKHICGRIVFNGNNSIFPSSEEMFLRMLERKILMEVKGFKHAGITLEYFDLQIK